MQSDNYSRGHQNRIVPFLNTFSTGILIVHQPAKGFLDCVIFACVPGTYFALLPRSKKHEERQEKEYFPVIVQFNEKQYLYCLN